MLERTASCIEPASQFFLRCLDPPLRSQRVIGQSFWRNGGNQLDVPPWWPLYLKKLRTSRQNEHAFYFVGRHDRTRDVAFSGAAAGPLRPPSSRRGRASVRPAYASSSRPYTKSRQSAREERGRGLLQSSDDGTEQARTSIGKLSSEADVSSSVQGSHAVASTIDELGSRQSDIIRNSTQANTPSYIHSEPNGSSLEQGEHPSLPLDDNLDSLWTHFVNSPQQESHGLPVFLRLAASDAAVDHARALEAFKIADPASKAPSDYEVATRLAVKAGKLPTAFSINSAATDHNCQQFSSVYLLVYTISNRLWSTASMVWKTSFDSISYTSYPPSVSSHTLVKELGKYRNMPALLTELGTRLRRKEPVIMRNSGILRRLWYELFSALVQCGPLIKIITPRGLRNLLALSEKLECFEPGLCERGIRTLNSFGKRPDGGRFADTFYSILRSYRPDAIPDPSTFRCLLQIHADRGATTETYFRYLDEYQKFHGRPDVAAFHLAMSAMARQGSIDGVQRAFIRLTQTHGYPKNPKYWTPLAHAYARIGDVVGTAKELENMSNSGVELNTYAWNTLLYAYTRSSDPSPAFKMLDAMKANGVTPDAYTFTILASTYARVGNVNAVLAVLDLAAQHQVYGTCALLTGLIQSYCLIDQPEVAERLAATATMEGLPGYQTTMWNYILRHYAFKADSTSMVRVQQRMVELGVTADGMTHATFMTALVVLGKTQEAVKILRSLSLSQTLRATRFHYAIVLQGFAQEGNRNMATVIYHEICERFPQMGASARLSMLRMKALRNPGQVERPLHAVKYLEEILHDLSAEDRASTEPEPGLRRRQGVRALPSMYVEYVVGLLLRKRQVKRAQRLLQRYETLRQTSFPHLQSDLSNSIPQLTMHLKVHAATQEWDQVEFTWKQILDCALRNAQQAASAKVTASDTSAHQRSGDDKNARPPRELRPQQPVGLPDLSYMTNGNYEFGSMIVPSSHHSDVLAEPDSRVLHGQRYILSDALDEYLRALSTQQAQQSALALVPRLEKMGFVLASKNWNTYLRTLAMSQNPDHWITAFSLFEQKMIQHTPPWSILMVGKWLPPQTSDVVPKAVSRQMIEKRFPGQLMPSYFTAAYLGRALLNAARLTETGDSSIVRRIEGAAPKTCQYIRLMPYMKDRVQGTVLRGIPEKLRGGTEARYVGEADRSGVLGSKERFDHQPDRRTARFRAALRRAVLLGKLRVQQGADPAVPVMERNRGQLSSGLVKRWAWETEGQHRMRLRSMRARFRRFLRQVRQDLVRRGAVSDEDIGQPTIPETPPSPTGSQWSGETAYGTRITRIIRKAEAQAKTRAERRAALQRGFRAFSADDPARAGGDTGRPVDDDSRALPSGFTAWTTMQEMDEHEQALG
jgi:pentatricopeptide repeat-containing protein PET309